MAPFSARMLSGLIDYAIPTMAVIFGAFIPVWWIFAIILFGSIGFQGWNQWTQGVNGQSVGKKLAHTSLGRQEDAQPVGAVIVFSRYFLHALDWVFLVGFLFPIWDKKRQTFADKLVQTVVIEETY